MEKTLTVSDISRMSEGQLRAYGKEYGVENADSLPVDDLAKKLTTVVEGSGVPDKPKKKAKKDERKRVWFKVMPDQRAAGDAPVFASVNGKTVMVHRNKWVPLPKTYLSCFRDAVETVVTTLKDGSTRLSQVPRYNFQTRPLTDINSPPDGEASHVDGF